MLESLRLPSRLLAALSGLALLAGLSGPVQADDRDPCLGLISSRDTLIHRVALEPGEVRLTFVGHATFVIESPGGVTAATDYNDYVRPSFTPDIATMNKAHSTHYSERPDPGIKHVLRGWALGGAARHDVTLGDMRVRNLPTNIRDFGGGTEREANSIFIFEMAGMCVAHLGHLHHPLTPGHLKLLGKIDVLLVPVDGSWTMDLDGMMEVIQAVNPHLVVPMHYFGPTTLNRFLDRARQSWPVTRSDSSSVVVSRATLPQGTEVLVLPGR